MPFFETEFPRTIGFTSTGGAAFNTFVNAGFSGFENRNRNWVQSRGMWQLLLNDRPQAEFENVYNFFQNVGGKADPWRLFWALDYSFAGSVIGTGDGTTTTFQLQKQYTTNTRTYNRIINKPITSLVKDFQGNSLTDTVNVYDNAVLQTHSPGYLVGGGYQYTLDQTTGVVTFTTPPAAGHIITADGQFHFPVRFDIDDMTNAQVLESDVHGGAALVTWSQVNIIEIRIEPGQSGD
jgi:uncharacterized protein (TIGR02217 family)